MKRWGRRIRSAVGVSLLWGAAWSLAGGVLARVPGFSSDLPFPYLFAALGVVTGIIFSGIVGTESRRGFQRESLARFAAWGAASGLLLAGIIVLGAALRGEGVWKEFLLFGPPLAMAGAVSGASSLALGRRAERRRVEGRVGGQS